MQLSSMRDEAWESMYQIDREILWVLWRGDMPLEGPDRVISMI